MKLSVIIVNYNVKYFLEQCLYTVVNAVKPLSAEIIVIDNNSSDESVEYLQPFFPNVIFIKNETNAGFGKANNLALRSARGEYILFLNPDTLIPEDCLEKCTRFLDSKPSAGALGIRMLDGSGQFLPESKRSFPTTAAAFYKLMGLSGLFPSSRRFNRYSLNYLDEQTNHSVEVLAGAFMMVRKSILDKIGGFDEQFFMYGEDIDLSYRIKQAGYENWYFAESSIIHFKGESTKKESRRYVKMFYEAMIVFVNKHHKGKGAWITRPVLKTGIGLRSLVSLISNHTPSKKIKRPTQKSIIIGNPESYNECLRILETKGDDTATTHLPFINEESIIRELQSGDAAEIIFCIGDLSFASVLNIIQQLIDQFPYRFHSAGSNSIIGSDSKEYAGEAIAID